MFELNLSKVFTTTNIQLKIDQLLIKSRQRILMGHKILAIVVGGGHTVGVNLLKRVTNNKLIG